MCHATIFMARHRSLRRCDTTFCLIPVNFCGLVFSNTNVVHLSETPFNSSIQLFHFTLFSYRSDKEAVDCRPRQAPYSFRSFGASVDEGLWKCLWKCSLCFCFSVVADVFVFCLRTKRWSKQPTLWCTPPARTCCRRTFQLVCLSFLL